MSLQSKFIKRSSRSLLRLSVPFGLLLYTTSSIAKPVIVQPITPNQDVTAVLMSDKLLGPFLLLNAIQLIFFLIKSIWNTEKKRLEEIQKAVAHIPAIVHKLDRLDDHVMRKVPTIDQTKLMIWEHVNDK